ncbi:unnamed protein product [Candidula unifasciata]|uniref:Protein broad-minded n=1 Tax=Candidula unifasciata TaxID=100452 RepID=A0A8S3Z2V1_9EUPU|nr:unnamed protein product [Candidula unifasciata]
MALRGLEGAELKKGLRELITSWESIVREAGSFEQVEDTLLHLEENDENFHKHDFIKTLKHKLEETLSNLIDEELDKYSTSGHIDSEIHETLVSQIIHTITQSKQYADLKKKLQKNISEAVDALIANFDSEFGIGRVTSDVDSVMLFNSDDLKSITDSLSKMKSASTRKEAMQKLNQIVSGEIVQNKHWPQLRKNLLDVMADPDDQLSELSLKFVAKSFTCTSHHTYQVYSLLMDFLCSQFNSKNFTMPLVQNGLDSSDKFMIKLLKAFRLMNEFQQEAPNYWGSLNLLMLQMTPQSPSTRLTPLHFIAVLDPRAQWFTKWMHCNYSRQELLDRLQQYKILVETSLKYCTDFSSLCKPSPDEMHEVTESLFKTSLTESGRRQHYSYSELEYALFIHSLSLLGKLLCYQAGRSFFPYKLKDKPAAVTVSQLLRALVQLIVDSGQTTQYRRIDKNVYESSFLVTEVFKLLCGTETTCSVLLCKDDIMSTLLSPMSRFLDGSHGTPAPNEACLLHVADILCVMASTAKGRQFLLYGESNNLLTRTKSSPAHLVAEFTKRALSSDLSRSSSLPSNAVVGAYLYVCRQLYSTCDGLLVLSQYELHTSIAQAWKKLQVAEKSGGSAMSMKTYETDKCKDTYISRDSWKEMLQDNLLNFASTAKGILLLQQTGALSECIQYMYSRYDKKLQVSKCEKFGYGYMVTQVAATATGIQALQGTGYIKALLMELWSSLECGPLDTPSFSPKAWPVDPIDRCSQKHFIRLVNILSAFPAVYEMICGERLPARETYSLRDIPDSITALIDRIIIVDSDVKIHSLFNYEESYTFGLRVLSAMVSCLDTYLLLESQYKFQEFLLKEQEANKIEDSGAIIADMLSVERNYILVKSYLVGGPSERTLPARTLEEDRTGNIQAPTLFSSYPVPKEYQPNVISKSSTKQENELTKFLNAQRAEKKPKLWVDKCRGALLKVMSTKPDQMKGNVLQQLLEQMVANQCQIQDEANLVVFSEKTIKTVHLSHLQQLGVQTAVRYGTHLKIVSKAAESTEALTHLMKQAACSLKLQQKPFKTSLKFLEDTYPGFDWFTATVYLIFGGNAERAWKFLHRFSALRASGYMWMARLHSSLLPTSLLSSGIPPLFSGTAHNIELLLQNELPLVVSAFKMSGYTPSQICIHWLTQCFWNYLDWLDIVHYIVVCVCMGIDYQVYMCVAIFRLLQEDILSHMQTHDLVIFLKEEAIRNFHVTQQIKYMKELEVKYRKLVLSDIMDIGKP